jgi:hypothetical protein
MRRVGKKRGKKPVEEGVNLPSVIAFFEASGDDVITLPDHIQKKLFQYAFFLFK